MIVCAGESEQFDFATPIGIGFVHAAISTTQICLKENPKFLMFVGTAGSYGNLDIFELFCSADASNLEIGTLIAKSYSPIKSSVNIKIPPNVSRETLAWLKVNSSNYITSDESVAKTFLNKGFSAENMEFYGFLEAAKRFKIPAFGLFIVTNYCNNSAHKKFIANHNKAKKILTETVKKQFGDLHETHYI